MINEYVFCLDLNLIWIDCLPSKEVTPAPHEAVHQDAGDGGGDGSDLDPSVCLFIDVVHRLPGLLGVHRKDDAAAVGW